MSWIPLKNFEDIYEIKTEYPYKVRKITTGRIVKEQEHQGYIRLNLNAKEFKKHRIIAEQFIPNDDPDNKTQIDHINHDKTDNHIENLRWCSPSDNLRNRTRANGTDYEYINTLPEDAINIDRYNKYYLTNYFFSKEANKFYFKIDNIYRVLVIHDWKGCEYVNVLTNEKKKIRLYLKTIINNLE